MAHGLFVALLAQIVFYCAVNNIVMEYVVSSRGQKQLIYKGFIHVRERNYGPKIIWKCAEYYKYSCHGRVHTVGEEVVKVRFCETV